MALSDHIRGQTPSPRDIDELPTLIALADSYFFHHHCGDEAQSLRASQAMAT